MEKLTKKFTSSAMPVVTESVKAEVKNAAIDAIPVGISLLVIFAGFFVFKGSSSAKAVAETLTPAVSKMSVTTNNYFFDAAMKADVLAKIIDK